MDLEFYKIILKKESKHIERNKTKWDRWAETADGKGKLYEYLRSAQTNLLASIGIKENVDFLDIGCGTGFAVGLAAEMAGYTGAFYGADLSPKMIEKARENFSDSIFHFIVADSESIPLENNSFDIIICTNSFHHYLHPGIVMKEISRLLKPSGRVYILDPAADLWIIKVADRILRLIEPEHVKIYSTAEFKKMIIGSGLKYVDSDKIEIVGNVREKVQIGEK
jgi:ubiquinone/menaquinone biosynthesis C-methylase UbiE